MLNIEKKREKDRVDVNDKKLAVVIVTYNRLQSVAKAIQSVFNSCPDCTIILIDNSPNTFCFENLKRSLEKCKNVFLFKNPYNYGFAKAVNQGIKIVMEKGKYDYILLLNDDAYLDKYCIPILIETLEKDERSLLAGPTIFYYRFPNKVWSAGGYFDSFTSRIIIPLKNKNVSIEELSNLSVKEVDFLTGCVLMIKYKAIKEIGLFDENFFFYSEDLDYSFRVKKAGYKCIWVPSAIAWHDIQIIDRFNSTFALYNLAKSGIIFRRKHFKGGALVVNLMNFVFFQTTHKFFYLLLNKGNLSSINAWFRGIIDGFREPLINNYRD
ncbi:MAG: glycosyltransferase family 2 protein [Candidatus Calescibacterium sp.]